MAGRIFLGIFPRTSCSYSAPRLNLWGGIRHRSYSTSERVKNTVKENFKVLKGLNFEQFKKTKVKSFEEFKQSPMVKMLFDNHMEKIFKAYEDYCVCKFNRYQLAEHGGNPDTLM